MSRAFSMVTNPVDGSIMGGSNLRPHEVIELIANSPSYDVVINNVGAGGPWGGNDPVRQQRANRILEHTIGISRNLAKPVALVLAEFTPETDQQLEATLELRHRCIEEGFAIFPSIGRASRAISRLVRYYRWREEELKETAELSTTA